MPTWEKPQLAEWKQALQAGEITASPAEGVYGYNANPFNENALQKLLKIKNRNASKGLILLLPNVEFLPQVTENLTEEDTLAIKKYWQKKMPPVTLILPAKKSLSLTLTGGRKTVAVRVPNCQYMVEYLHCWNAPLVSTSLNKSGEKPLVCANKILAGIKFLELKTTLSGEVSKLFNPATNEFLR